MLTIYASKQQTFNSYLLTQSLAKNPLLLKVDSILSALPALLQPLVDTYLNDRKTKGIDPNFGRPTIALETFIRILLLKYLYKNCDLREVENRTKTDLSWKAFAKLSVEDSVPDFTTLNNWELFFGEQAIRKLHDQVVDYCQGKKLIKAKSLRVDTTVTEANIHYPTDASLLKDAVTVITRTVKKIQRFTTEKLKIRCRIKAIKQKVYGIVKVLKRRTNEAKQQVKQITKEIFRLARATVNEAAIISKSHVSKALKDKVALAKRLLKQTSDVLKGKKIKDRIVSFFQPSMRPIVKGKLGKPVEFGKKIEIVEVENNLISDYQIHLGNPNDAGVFLNAITRHKQRFKYLPTLVATDRGGWAEENVKELMDLGVKQVSIPKRGYKTKQRARTEHSQWFTAGQRWRAGGEAKISWLKRSFGMGRSRAKTERGYDSGIGMSVLACNLKRLSFIT